MLQIADSDTQAKHAYNRITPFKEGMVQKGGRNPDPQKGIIKRPPPPAGMKIESTESSD